MKTQRIVAAVAAASLAFSSAAFAQSLGASEQAMRENGIQNPNGPLKSALPGCGDSRAAQSQNRAATAAAPAPTTPSTAAAACRPSTAAAPTSSTTGAATA